MLLDFETFVGANRQLFPNLAAVECNNGKQKFFSSDGVIGPDVTEELRTFLFQETHEGFYVNFQTFDGMFFLRRLLANKKIIRCCVAERSKTLP